MWKIEFAWHYINLHLCRYKTEIMKRYILTLFILCFMHGSIIYAVEKGTASFYGKKFNGRRTASGEKLDNTLFTAAHRSLPFGTLVKVTNTKNNKSVIVKINDRGITRSRIIDLTYAAAKEIDMIRDGVVKVEIEVVNPEDIPIVSDSIPLTQTDTLK